MNKGFEDPFGFYGMHPTSEGVVVRACFPRAGAVAVRDLGRAEIVARMQRTGDDGVFAATIARSARFPYRLVVEQDGSEMELEDPYRFGPILGDVDVHLIAEGTHLQVYEKLGAHPVLHEGVDGVFFAMWAPNASRASVVGDFNEWDGRRHPMRKRFECGVWEIFIPQLEPGALYKFELADFTGALLPLKADPYALQAERPPATASVVAPPDAFRWTDSTWMQRRATLNKPDQPISIYEVHLGSWKRGDGNRYLGYSELADRLLPYVRRMGFTHVELMPVAEYPFDGSWGYQPVSLYAPTRRFGTPDEFRSFVDRAHALGIGVVMDWVSGHFPDDSHGLARFDGTALYEHDDPRQGFHPDWNTCIYNHGRREVANFLIANALFWFERYHIDALRVDAVASMLYLDYGRASGEWIPNEHGGNENFEAVSFLKRMNEAVFARHPDITTIAEESTAWPMVSRPTYAGGLGFGYKWNMGWMHDTLQFFGKDPIHRRHHQNLLTFGLLYAFSENYVLPLSHDEVVHGKGSLFNKMPGTRWQQFANLRMLYGLMYAHPGKKLLFMGDEFAQESEWNHDRSLDWHLLERPEHAGISALVHDLNALYRSMPALYALDAQADGFEWIDFSDAASGVIAFLRRDRDAKRFVVVVAGLTPVVRENYRIGAPRAGFYREVMNTDWRQYGGCGVDNAGGATAQAVDCSGREFSLELRIPPLGIVMLEWQP
ncbi:MAG: 1,4-alpha-glucan branching protein GlgB [Candidatus Tyrphobacter sp.]